MGSGVVLKTDAFLTVVAISDFKRKVMLLAWMEFFDFGNARSRSWHREGVQVRSRLNYDSILVAAGNYTNRNLNSNAQFARCDAIHLWVSYG